MNLYNVPQKTWVRLQENQEGPPSSPNFEIGDEIFFDHLDGMYSFCKDKQGNVVHLPAWSKVTPLTTTRK